MAGEDRAGKRSFKMRARGTVADDQGTDRRVRRLRRVYGAGEGVDAFFKDQPSDEGDDDIVVAEALRAPPAHVAPARIEQRLIDAARPQANVGADPVAP